MKQEMYVLPVKCAGCYRVFDLWQVLRAQENSKKSVNDYGGFHLQQSLCSRCQKLVSQETADDEDNESGDNTNQEMEYQMTLEFE